MKKLIILIILFGIIYQIRPIFAQEDSSGVAVGKDLKIKIENAQFGFIVKASENENTQLEAIPMMSIGLSLSIIKRDIYGINFYGLFTTDGDKTYPLAAFGVSFFQYKLAMCYLFGKVSGNIENSYKQRLGLLFSFNLFNQ